MGGLSWWFGGFGYCVSSSLDVLFGGLLLWGDVGFGFVAMFVCIIFDLGGFGIWVSGLWLGVWVCGFGIWVSGLSCFAGWVLVIGL